MVTVRSGKGPSWPLASVRTQLERRHTDSKRGRAAHSVRGAPGEDGRRADEQVVVEQVGLVLLHLRVRDKEGMGRRRPGAAACGGSGKRSLGRPARRLAGKWCSPAAQPAHRKFWQLVKGSQPSQPASEPLLARAPLGQRRGRGRGRGPPPRPAAASATASSWRTRRQRPQRQQTRWRLRRGGAGSGGSGGSGGQWGQRRSAQHAGTAAAERRSGSCWGGLSCRVCPAAGGGRCKANASAWAHLARSTCCRPAHL